MEVTIKRVNRGRGHAYRVEGDPLVAGVDLPSVTTILNVINKPALVGWARNDTMANVRSALLSREAVMSKPFVDWLDDALDLARGLSDATRSAAADYGTEAHALIESIIKGEEPKIPKAFAATIAGFQAWRKTHGVVLDSVEQPLYSASLGAGGTLDLRGYMGAKSRTRFIADIKTGNAVYQEAWLQLCAYWLMHEEMGLGAIDEAWVLRLPKEAPEELAPAFEAKRVLSPAMGMTAFSEAANLYKGLRIKDIWEDA